MLNYRVILGQIGYIEQGSIALKLEWSPLLSLPDHDMIDDEF
jgi:hypothetical protein